MAGTTPPSPPQGSPGITPAPAGLPSYEEATTVQQHQQQTALVPVANVQAQERARTSTQDSIASTGSDADAQVLPPTPAAKIAKLFQDHGHDFRAEDHAEIRWTIDSWADMRTQEKVLSPPIKCFGREWRILLFPNGNGRSMSMSMYLQLDWPDKKDDEAVPADFVLGIVNPEDESVSHFQYSSHRFGEVEMDWGFSAFLPFQDMPKFCQRVPVPTTPVPDPAATTSTSTDAAAATTAAPTTTATTDPASPPTTPPAAATPSDLTPPRTSSATATPLATQHGYAQKTTLVAHVRALYDETGVMFHSFKDYNSKRVTGYVGLKNQGATCYMNSILQSLFCTNYFRKAVYQIPPPPSAPGTAAVAGSEHGSTTDVLASSQPGSALESSSASSSNGAAGNPQRSVTRALQRLFYFMQTASDAVETNELTKSFGWNTVDAFAQHDVQEFLRVLSDNLEEKMKGTPADGMIQWLFVGKMKSYIKCVNVEYESARVEDFYDVQLNVKGMKSVTESFNDYIQVEMLEGDNKYMAEGHGLQDAKKGVVFTQFPPVLHLQLKRFEYDFMRDAMVKINDRYEFPLELSLDEFLMPEGAAAAAPPVKQTYHLHGVLVHSGSVDAGHYCAFIRPSRANKWYKFDDDKVVPVTVKEVTEDNYGGEYPARPGARPMGPVSRGLIHKRFTNAYMLVYIREADYDKVLCDVTEDDVPRAIRDQLEQERLEREAKEREVREREYMLTVRIIDDAAIKTHGEFDLWNFTSTSTEWQKRLDKNETKWSDVHAMYAREHLGGKPLDQIRFWLLTNRENKSLRPDSENLLSAEDGELSLKDLRARNANSGSPYELLVYCEVPTIPWGGVDGTQLFPPSGPALAKAGLKAGTALLFVKVFDVATQTMRVVGHMHVDRNAVIKDSLPTVCTLAGLPVGTKLRVFEEVHQTMQQAMNVKSTWKAEEVVDGDIIAVQVDTPAAEAGMGDATVAVPTSPKTSNHHISADTTAPATTTAATPSVPVAGHLRTVLDYYEFLVNRMDVVFKPKPPGRDNHSLTSPMSVTAPTLPPELRLTLSKKMTYDEISARVARELGLDDPFKVRFTSTYYNDVPKAVIRRVPTILLADMVGTLPMTGFYRTQQQQQATATGAPPAGTLLYEILPMSLVEMEQKRQLKVTCVLPAKHDEHLDVMIAKTATMKQLAHHVAEKLSASIGGAAINPESVRINEMMGSRLHREYDGKEPLSMLPDYVQLVAQIMPSVPAGAHVVHNMPVVHMHKAPTQLHGTPFRFPVVKGEKVAAMRARLQQYLGWSDKEMGKVTPLKMVAVGAMDEVRELADDECVADMIAVKPAVPIVSVPIVDATATAEDKAGDENVQEQSSKAKSPGAAGDDKPVIHTHLLLALDHPVRRASRFVSGLERAVKIFN